MTIETVKQALQSVAFTTPTPFSDDASAVRTEEIAPIVDHIEDAGGTLFLPCGNTGEYYALSPSERIDVVRETVAASSPDSVVIGGAGGSVKEVLELARAYDDAGADAIMVMNPSHTFLHKRGLVEYYEQIVRGTELPVVLYKRGPEVPIDVIDAVSTYESVVGVKFAVNDVNAFSRAIDTVDGDVIWCNGIAERFAPSFALEGAEGFTTGIGSFAPRASLSLMDAVQAENWQRAKEIRDAIRPFEELRAEEGRDNPFEAANNVPAIKYGLELAGLYGGPVKAPIVELTEENKERARRCYDRISDAPAIVHS